jgi:hypothetical protein
MNMTLILRTRERRVSQHGGHFLLSRGLHPLKRMT